MLSFLTDGLRFGPECLDAVLLRSCSKSESRRIFASNCSAEIVSRFYSINRFQLDFLAWSVIAERSIAVSMEAWRVALLDAMSLKYSGPYASEYRLGC